MRSGMLFAAAVLAVEVYNGATITNYWLNYILTVEKPVTLVAQNSVIRRNGSCCSPDSVNVCTMCPDDPNIEYSLQVCFRTGYAHGHSIDPDYCPLGGTTFTPNIQNGVPSLTAHLEATDLPKEYPGAVQMYVQIMARVNGRDVLVDYAFVYGHRIPADGTFRRIMYLSSKHVALVGANVAVRCTNDAGTPDCSLSSAGVETDPPPPLPSAPTVTPPTEPALPATEPPLPATEPPALPVTKPQLPATTKETTNSRTATSAVTEAIGDAKARAANCSVHNLNFTLNKETIYDEVSTHELSSGRTDLKTSKCVGMGFAAGGSAAVFFTLLITCISCCLYKKSTRKAKRVYNRIIEATPLENALANHRNGGQHHDNLVQIEEANETTPLENSFDDRHKGGQEPVYEEIGHIFI